MWYIGLSPHQIQFLPEPPAPQQPEVLRRSHPATSEVLGYARQEKQHAPMEALAEAP